jgi:energy-coupling factor transporter ATP-binding protein EcfA2
MRDELDDLELEEDEPISVSPLVSHVSVTGLHGRANYNLDLQTSGQEDRLTLLYGDNGSGKTTILRVLWDLLSPAPDKKHRSRVAAVAFSDFTIHMTDGVSLHAKRKLPVAGPYDLETRRRGRLLSKSRWPERLQYEEFFESHSIVDLNKYSSSNDPDIIKASKEVLAKKKYLQLIENLGSPPLYLADDRSTSSDRVERVAASGDIRRVREARLEADGGALSRNALASELQTALAQVNSKLRRITLGGSVSGSEGTNSVYREVVERLSNSSRLDTDATATRLEIIGRVVQLGARSQGYESIGLVPPFRPASFVRQIATVPESNLAVLRAILDPYFESLSARMDAMEKPRALIQTLVDEANEYLTDKQLVYRGRVLRIELLDGQPLKASQLSSGECQLLLLLFNAVVATGDARLFLIDEPELSLNVKWQRRIVDSLLSLTEGSGLQFMLATHSIELLSAHRKRVVVLRPELIG